MAQVSQQAYPAQQQQYCVPQQPQHMAEKPSPPTTASYTASGTPIKIVNVGSNELTYEHYQSNSARILGVLQILLGCTILITQIIVTALEYAGYQLMAGFYSPIIFILAGAFGVQSANSKSQCSVTATMVFSILSSILSIAPISQGSAGVIFATACLFHRSYDDCTYGTGAAQMDSAIAFHSIMLIAGFIELIVAIIAAAYCCHGCCCHSHQGVVHTQGPGAPGTSMTTVAYPYNGGYPAQAALNPGSYPQPNGAWPQYTGAAPPPGYKEKI